MSNNIIIKYTKKYKFRVIAIVLINLGFILLTLLPPLVTRYFVDEILIANEIDRIPRFSILFVTLYVTMSIGGVLVKYMIITLTNTIAFDVRNELYNSIVYQPLKYHKEQSIGKILERTMRDADVVHSIWGFLLPSVFSSAITFSVILIFLLSQSVLITALALISVILYSFVFLRYNDKLRKQYEVIRSASDKINSSILEVWNGIKEVKIFQLEQIMLRRLSKETHMLKRNNINMGITREYSNNFMNLATILGTLITSVIGAYMVASGALSVGMLIAILAYVSKLFSPARDLADMGIDYKKYSVSLNRINQVLTQQKEQESSEKSPDLLHGNIEISNISFSYEKQPVLKNISLTLPQTGSIAIIGKSGSGKSTLTSLLYGLMTPANGTISIDGKLISEIPLSQLRSSIAIASQDAYMFNLSIYENIKLGNSSASESEISSVIRLLRIDELAENLPKKLDTVSAEFGKNISGGQLQRISIARALLKRAPILILDEATSNIDSQSEEIIHNALENIRESTLIIIISHRLSSLKNTEKIFVLDKGSIVQEGALCELVNSKGKFKEIFQEQLAHYK